MTMFTLPSLPYSEDSLNPYISAETIAFHYGKHHQTYVDNLNKLIVDTEFAQKTLEEIILTSNGGIFNNASQVWNHTFYWNSLTPNFDQNISDELQKIIEENFTSIENFKEQFTKNALTLFGSGWVWLVKDTNNKLSIVQTSNANSPLTSNLTPLLVCDVWEHAYYIDYRNARAKYIDNFWHMVNWNFVLRNYNNSK